MASAMMTKANKRDGTRTRTITTHKEWMLFGIHCGDFVEREVANHRPGCTNTDPHITFCGNCNNTTVTVTNPKILKSWDKTWREFTGQ